MRRRVDPGDSLAELGRQIHAFTASCDDNFTEDFFGDQLFATAADARAAWPSCRRAVWAGTFRMNIPRASLVFDALTADGWKFLWSHWNRTPFQLAEALAAIHADRVSLAAFERRNPKGARDVADFLALWREDLATLDQLAHEFQLDCYAGAITRMSSGNTYGGVTPVDA